ncbi:XRE family transcriptional regulator [Saccharothrix violaceirubra]|uniref:Transcriptional regulator n=1 Tax=Saccharothrix violaceirubra TaxID=413306 RepID=A0A7W7WTV5_9PSEU|nr:XRE family transcriptional regulator [Saccharothrix violaceirubra]MBB4963541.1 hypothetical protein [Saccharothrix violaceirubra]
MTRIKRSMGQAGEPEPGLTAEVVRRWESGDRKPEPRYQKHLVQVFRLPASDLGLLSSEELALRPRRPAEPPAVTAQDVDAIVRKVTLVLLGNGNEFNRKMFLTGQLGASLTPLLTQGLALPDSIEALTRTPGSTLDPRAVDAFAAIATSHRSLYWTRPAADLLPAVVSHAQFGENLLKTTTSVGLAAAVAESALLAARLAFFDLDREDLAGSFFRLAQDAADHSRDHGLAAAVLAHRAFVPGFAGRGPEARALLAAAHAHVRYDGGPLLRSWLHCVDSEISARTGQAADSVARIRAAEDALTTIGTDALWLDFYDSARLDGFAGNSLLLAGRPHDATPRLRNALDRLSPTAGKQRAVVLFDLAAAQASTDAELAYTTAGQACDLLGQACDLLGQACDLLGQACDLLGQDGYAMAAKRAPEVGKALAGTPYAALLRERVRAATSG